MDKTDGIVFNVEIVGNGGDCLDLKLYQCECELPVPIYLETIIFHVDKQPQFLDRVHISYNKTSPDLAVVELNNHDTKYWTKINQIVTPDDVLVFSNVTGETLKIIDVELRGYRIKLNEIKSRYKDS